jgi:lysophospholipase L1-like esterase
MMRARALLLGLTLATACSAGRAEVRHVVPAPPSGPMAAPGVRAIGRFDAQDPAGARFAWSGSGVALRFKGTQLDARLKAGAGGDTLAVVVDGKPAPIVNLRGDKELYPIVTGLPDGEHEVEIVKRTEARVGEVQLLGFAQPLLDPPPAPARRIEVIGDSISAGYGNEGPDQHCRYTPATENATATYGWLAAKSLHAEASIVAWSGKTIDDMAGLYDRAVPTRPGSRWDPNTFVPDAVVINLGTNDVTRGDSQAPFVASLVKLVDRVRLLYPSALIVCCVGSMLTDTYPPGKQTLTRARTYVKAAVEQKRSAADTRVTFLEFPTQDPAVGYGCDYHPSAKTHQIMAERLAAHLKTELGW